jgi:L-methionine (R)-S-oxide reductase
VTTEDRVAALQEIADLIRSSGNYRWVGLYDVNYVKKIVENIVFSGPGAPEYPTFPITKGLTARAISNRQTVNVGEVAADPSYLTAFGTTRSEIIVPVFDRLNQKVVGTIDVESEQPPENFLGASSKSGPAVRLVKAGQQPALRGRLGSSGYVRVALSGYCYRPPFQLRYRTVVGDRIQTKRFGYDHLVEET